MMDRAEIEKLLDDTIAASHLPDRLTAADHQRMVSELHKQFERREAGIVDLQEERAIRLEMEFLRRVDREFPGWTDLRWNGSQWIVTMPSGDASSGAI
jgi:hypothetical protein